MRKLKNNPNVILSDSNYPNGRIRNNTGAGNGTPVNEGVYGDVVVNKDKLLDLYGIIPNNLPDNEANGYQIIESHRALATKNDFILPLNLNTGVLSVPIKLSYMLENEQVVCKAGFDLGSETQIKGSDNVILSFTSNGSFKTNEYVRLIKTSSAVLIVRLVDNTSLDNMVASFDYLKKASQSEENTGTSDVVATTPKVNKVAYALRTIGADSVNYLATAIRNGLYPKEHFVLVDKLNKIKNIGWFSGLDINSASPGTSFPVGGDIASAVVFASGIMSEETFVLVTLQNTMINTSYYVRSFIESLGSLNQDNDIDGLVFKIVSATQFQIAIKENASGTQSLKIHFEAIQI